MRDVADSVLDMHGTVANGDLSPLSSLAFEIGGLVHVAVDAAMNTGNGVSGGQAFGTSVHSKSFRLKGLFEDSNASRDLNSL